MEDGLISPEKPEASEPAAYKPDLSALKTMFEEHQTATQVSRQESRIDQDFYDGDQFTSAERRTLRARKQPDNVFNLTRVAVNGTLGVIKQNATDPRAYPRNPQDEDSADVASKTLRFIADKNKLKALKVDVAKDFLVAGTGAVIVEADEDGQVTIQQIRWEEFIYDPYSRRQDFKDARYLGIARWMYADDVVALYPDQESDILAAVEAGKFVPSDLSFADRPGAAAVAWTDSKKRRLMVVEIYHREGGKWRRCVFHSGGILEATDSEYLDAKKRPACPIEAQSCYVDSDNARSGIVRDMRGPQNEINKRHSKTLHLLNTRQVQESQPGAGMGTVDEVRKEAARPDGVLPIGWQIVPNGEMVAGHVQLLQEAKGFLERFAPNPAMLGRQGQDKSGRAKQIDQQAGLTELAVVFGGVEDWELRTYEQCWNRARQFWVAPDWVRVTDDEGAPEFVGINQPIEGPPQVGWDAAQGKVTLQPTVLGYKNALAELDVDIVLDTVPDTANLQAEQFPILASLAEKFPNDVSFDDILELSTMPNKRQMMEKRKARKAEAGQAPPDPAKVAEVENTKADTGLKQAQTEKAFADAFQTIHAGHAARAMPAGQPRGERGPVGPSPPSAPPEMMQPGPPPMAQPDPQPMPQGMGGYPPPGA